MTRFGQIRRAQLIDRISTLPGPVWLNRIFAKIKICFHDLPWSGSRLNMKMLSYQYRDPRVKYKTVYHLIVNMGIPIPRKDGIYIETRSCLEQLPETTSSDRRNHLVHQSNSRNHGTGSKSCPSLRCRLSADVSIFPTKIAWCTHMQIVNICMNK